MQSEFTVAFKAYVKKDEENLEIRYFTIDRGAEYNFEYLKAKLMNVFPCLSKQPFVISWMDNESDLVAISSDSELLFALTCMSSDVKKLYVTFNKIVKEEIIEIPVTIGVNSSRKRSSTPTMEHPYVVCDNCDGVVIGFRYKCVICPDYDLCQSCEGNGKHPEHLMLRIPKPLDFDHNLQLGNSIDNFANLSKTCDNSEFPRGKKHCRESRRGCHKDKHGEKHGDKRDEKHGRHGRHERKHVFKACGKMSEPWVNTFTSFMNDFTNLAEDVGKKPEQKQNTQPQENQPSSPNQGNTNANSNEQNVNIQQLFAPEIELFRNFLKGVTNGFCGEKGFEGTPSKSQEPSTSQNMEAKNESMEKSTATDDFKQQSNKNIAKNVSFAAATSASVNSSPFASYGPISGDQAVTTATDNALPMNNTTVHNNVSRESDNESTESDCMIVKSSDALEKGDDWTMLNTDEPGDNELIQLSTPAKNHSLEKDMDNMVNNFEKHMEVGGEIKAGSSHAMPNKTPAAQPSVDETRFILIDTSSNLSSANNVAQVNASNKTQTVNPPPSAPPVHHRDPQVALALEQMMSMGFSNEDGWLTQLLESGNGNINRVLDILSSVKK